MAWTAADAPAHHPKTKDRPALQRAWAVAANAAFDEHDGDEAKAIADANMAIDEVIATVDRNSAGLLTRDASAGVKLEIRPNSYDPKTRTADVMMSTGARVRRRDFDGEFDELLDMSPTAVRLSRLNAGAQFIDSHQAWRGLDAVMGAIVPGSARIENGALWARMKLSRSDKGERIARDLADGITIPVSVGYRTHREVTDNNTSPKTRVAVDWEPWEISYAPIPHEAGAAFRAALGDLIGLSPQPGVHTMTKLEEDKARAAQVAADEAKKRAADEAAAATAEADKKRAADEAAQRARDAATAAAAGSTELVKRAADDAAKAAREYAADMMAAGEQATFKPEEIQAAIRAAEPIEDFRKRALAHLAGLSKGREISNVNISMHDNTGTVDGFDANGRVVMGIDRDKLDRVRAMSEAYTAQLMSSVRVPIIQNEAQAHYAKRMGYVDAAVRAWGMMDGHEKPKVERTRQYLGASLMEMAAECLGFRGNIRTPEQGYELIRRAYMTTSDFPLVLEGIMHGVLLPNYQLALPTYREIARQTTFNDFRDHPQYRVGTAPMLKPVNEAGELTAGGSTETKESAKVAAYGVYMAFTRQLLINDDKGAMNQLLASNGKMVALFENQTFYAMFNANPVLKTDNKGVFDAAHKNVSSGGHEPSVTAISDGRKAMRGQTDISGNVISVSPSIILSGGAHETRIEQLVTAVSPTLQTAVNPFTNRLRPVVEGLITGNEWYLFASPQDLPNYVYGFLAGQNGPRTATDEPFTVQGIRVKIEHDFGVGAIDSRGAWKDTGSAPTDLVPVFNIGNIDELAT